MERRAEYRGCRIDASVFATGARAKVSTLYQITPLTDQARVGLGGPWKRIAKAGTQLFRDMESSGGDPLPGAMEMTLRLATEAIDGIFAVAKSEQAEALELKEKPQASRRRAAVSHESAVADPKGAS